MITPNLLSNMREHVRAKYDVGFSTIGEETLNRVKQYFTDVQSTFVRNSKFPDNAYSRTIRLNWKPNNLEIFHLREMGFILGEMEHVEFHSLDGDLCGTTVSAIQIPEIKEGTMLTPAQKVYEEHVSKINELLEETVENSRNYLQTHFPNVLAIVDNMFTRLKTGDFDVKVYSHNPDKATISITMNFESVSSGFFSKEYHTPGGYFTLRQIIESYIVNHLSLVGFIQEEGISSLSFEGIPFSVSGKYIFSCTVQLP